MNKNKEEEEKGKVKGKVKEKVTEEKEKRFQHIGERHHHIPFTSFPPYLRVFLFSSISLPSAYRAHEDSYWKTGAGHPWE